jgi:hypothetical protein
VNSERNRGLSENDHVTVPNLRPQSKTSNCIPFELDVGENNALRICYIEISRVSQQDKSSGTLKYAEEH